MREDWQVEQGKRCGCAGSDEFCPCQNISPAQKAEIEKTSPRVLISEVQDALRSLRDEIKIGPDGEGQDWRNTLEACSEDLDTVLKQI